MRSSTSKPDMSGSRRSSTTQSQACWRNDVERFAAGPGGDDLDVVVTEQFADAHLLGLIVLDHQQSLPPRLREILDLRERFGNALARRRLGDEGEGAARKPVLAILVERDDLHRDVPGQRVLLELAQHGPAEHVGQEHVERHRRRLVLLGKIERIVAAHRDQHLEALVAGEVDQDARIVRIVLDDEQDGVARLDIQPIVRDLLDRALGRHVRRRACIIVGGAGRPRRRGRAHIFERQVEREGATHCPARCADGFRRRAGSTSSRLIARPRPVPPYLRLVLASACWNASKMIFCFSERDADAGVGDLERHHRRRLLRAPDGSGLQPPTAADTFRRTPPCAVNLKAFDSRFLSTCCSRLESVVMLRPRLGSRWTSNDELPRLRLVAERPRDHVEQVGEEDLLGVDRDGAGFDLRQVENVADQVEQVGAGAVDGAGELDLLRRQVAFRVVGELLAEDEDAS